MINCLFAALSAYAMVAFVNLELNPGLWGEASRFVMIVVAMFLGAVFRDDKTA
jgi:hypothetical protein